MSEQLFNIKIAPRLAKWWRAPGCFLLARSLVWGPARGVERALSG